MVILIFTMGFMNHSKWSLDGWSSWETNDGWEDGLGIWFVYFPTSTLSHGGTHIGTGKGGGKWTKGTIGSSSEIWGVSQFLKVGRIRTLGGLDSHWFKEIWTKCYQIFLKKSQSIYFSRNSWLKWRIMLEKYFIGSLGSILCLLILL